MAEPVCARSPPMKYHALSTSRRRDFLPLLLSLAAELRPGPRMSSGDRATATGSWISLAASGAVKSAAVRTDASTSSNNACREAVRDPVASSMSQLARSNDVLRQGKLPTRGQAASR